MVPWKRNSVGPPYVQPIVFARPAARILSRRVALDRRTVVPEAGPPSAAGNFFTERVPQEGDVGGDRLFRLGVTAPEIPDPARRPPQRRGR